MLLKNIFYSTATNIGLVILPFAVIPYLTRILGPEELGKITFVTSVFAIFNSCSSIGLNLFGKQRIAKFKSSKFKRDTIFSAIFYSKLIAAFVSTTIYIFMVINFIDENKELFFILILQLTANIFDVTYSYQALLKFKKLLYVSLIPRIVSVLLIVLLVVDENSSRTYLILVYFASFASCFYLFVTQDLFHINRFKIKYLYYILCAAKYFLMNLMTIIEQNVDRITIGFASTTFSQLAFYYIAVKIVGLFSSLIISISNVIMPYVASESQFESKPESKITKLMCIIIIVSSLCALNMLMITNVTIIKILGDSYEGSILFFETFAFLVASRAVNIYLQQGILIGYGHIRKVNELIGVSVLITVPIYIFLLSKFDVISVAIAAAALEFVKANYSIYITNLRNNILIYALLYSNCIFLLVFHFYLKSLVLHSEWPLLSVVIVNFIFIFFAVSCLLIVKNKEI